VINGVESAISWSECLEKNTTGVEENRFEAVVYPNPASGVVRIEGVEEFGGFDDWMDKYQLLIDLGNEQEPLEEKYKTESNLIDGCQSRVWLVADYEDGVIRFKAESDALIVKGIVSLLIRVLSGHTPQEILDAELYFIDEIGLKEHLSPTRSNGLLAMVKQMRMYALAWKAKAM
jgi:cysteine desulfuration protein SufE